MSKKRLRLNPLLEHQLIELGIVPTVPPNQQQWDQFLHKISEIYTDYQTAEVDLRQSELLYEDLYNSTWRQTQELSLLVRVREALASKIHFKEVIHTVVEATAEAFGYDFISIYLLCDGILYLQHQIGYTDYMAEVPLSTGVMGRVARTGEAAFIADSRTDPDFIGATDGFFSEVCVPIRSKNQVIGILNVETQYPTKLTPNDLALLTSISEHVGLAMERAELYNALKESTQKYQMVVDNIGEVIFQVNTDGYITFLNPAWQKLSGYAVENSLGKHFVQFIVPDEINALTQLQQLLIDGERTEARFTSRIQKADGSGVPVEASIQRIYDSSGLFSGLGGTVIDISQRIQAEQNAREMQLLVQVQETISTLLGLKEMISSVVETAAAIFGYDLVCIYLLEGDTLRLQHQVGYEQVIEAIPLNRGIAGRVVRTKRPVLIEDVSQDGDFLGAQNGIGSEICVPLLNKGEAIGFINVETKAPKRLGLSDFNILIRLGEQVSVAVERAKLYTAVEESNQRYQMVVNNVHEVIFQLDAEGHFTFLNQSWMALSGYSIEHSLGKHFSLFIPAEEVPTAEALGDILLRGEQDEVRYQHMLVRADQSIIPLEVRMQVVYNANGNLMGIAGTAIDISERMQAEKQALDLLLQTRTVEVLRGFLTGVSHDLRTPLSIMNTSLYLLRRKLSDRPDEMRHVDALDTQTAYMQRVVEDMLYMSKLDEDVARIEPIRVSINGLIRDLLVTLGVDADNKQQQIVFTPHPANPVVWADQSMLGRALRNVLANAIQYTPNGGQVTIETWPEADSMVLIAIHDSGIGIDPQTLPLIFDRFYKADPARPIGQGGMGLGLSIARRILELHHGTITAVSTPDEGSTFTIRLPTKPT